MSDQETPQNGQLIDNKFTQEARRQRDRGFAIAWLRPGEKRPLHERWTTRSQESTDYFVGANLAILPGWLSRNLVGVDLDAKTAFELAAKHLPPTGMIDGRPGKPRSHWWYIVTDVPENMTSTAPQAAEAAREADTHPGPWKKAFRHAETGKTLIDFQGTGSVLTIPPTLVGDEQRVWYEEGEPAALPMQDLWERVCDLAAECGWKRPTERVRRATETLRKEIAKPAVSGQGGHDRLYQVCRMFVNDHKLTAKDAWVALLEFNEFNEPPWSEQEMKHKLRSAIEAGPDLRFPAGRLDRPTVQVNRNRSITVSDAIGLLASDPDVYQRDNKLVRVVRTLTDEMNTAKLFTPAGSARIVYVKEPTAFERLSDLAEWQVFDPKTNKEKPVQPPKEVVQAVLVRGEYPHVRLLVAVVEAPVLRPDGSLIDGPGYDRATGVLYSPSGMVCEVPDEPTLEQAKEALQRLLYLVTDFRFDRPQHVSAWLSHMLTPFARYAFRGPAPMHMYDAAQAGEGKGLLASLSFRAFLNREMTTRIGTDNNEEMRKAITTIALYGHPMVCFDNITGPFGCGALDSALTSTQLGDRLLGKNEDADCPLLVTWCATANNVVLKGDLHRRILYIRLRSEEEKPQYRAGFKEPDLKGHVERHRGEYVSAILTILRGYAVAGRPKPPGFRPLGSFEGWSDWIRGAIVWIGMDDPCLTTDQAREELHAESSDAKAVMDCMLALGCVGDGWTADAIRDKCNNAIAAAGVSGATDEAKELGRNAAAMKAAIDGDNPVWHDSNKTSRRLGKLKGQVVGDHCFAQRRGTGGVMLYSAQKVIRGAASD